MSFVNQFGLTPNNSGVYDAFGRVRTSNPASLFDCTLQYGLKTWSNSLYDTWEQTISGAGSAVTHNPNESSASLTLGTVSGGKVVRQQHVYNRYQPLKSQLISLTGVITPKANVRVRLGYFDALDGVFFEQAGTTGAAWTIRTSTSGSAVDTNTALKANWNIDKFDGTGPSGLTLDFTVPYSIIWVIDLEWLSRGCVRVGFLRNNVIWYCHIFNLDSALLVPYMKTANLPIRYEIENTGTAASETTLKQICCAVLSEGGFEIERSDSSVAFNDGTSVIVDSTLRPVLTIRPKQTFNSINNNGILEFLDVQVSCATKDVDWFLYLNPTITGGSAASWVSAGGTKILEYDVSQTGTTSNPVITNGSIEAMGTSIAGSGSSKGQIAATSANTRILLSRNIDYTLCDSLCLAAKTTSGTATVTAIMSCREFK